MLLISDPLALYQATAQKLYWSVYQIKHSFHMFLCCSANQQIQLAMEACATAASALTYRYKYK